MFTTGTTVWLTREQGEWVVHSRVGDRLKCIGRTPIGRNYQDALTARIVGEGDAVLVKAAPTYQPGQSVTHNGKPHTVLADLGDAVNLEAPASHYPTRHGGHLHVAAGNVITVSKCDLVLED